MDFLHTSDAPEAVGPYSQAVKIDGYLYTSGQVGIEPGTGALVDGGFDAQARRVMKNLEAVLDAGGSSFDDVVKATIYVTDLGNFAVLNQIYAEAMGEHRPARSTVEVSALPLGALVEIDLVARVR